MEAYVIRMDEDNDMCMLTVVGPTHEIKKQILKLNSIITCLLNNNVNTRLTIKDTYDKHF